MKEKDCFKKFETMDIKIFKQNLFLKSESYTCLRFQSRNLKLPNVFKCLAITNQ